MYKVIHNKKIQENRPLTMTIGNFDGIHLGHQKLIQTAITFTDTDSAVLTFDPHPISLFTQEPYATLMDIECKMDAFTKLGINHIYVKSFTRTFSSLSVEAFINFLKSLNVKRVVVGEDFKFAHKGSGTVEDLKANFEVIVVLDVKEASTRISTSYIKDLLAQGNLPIVHKLLTKNYQIRGTVVHGNKVGRTLGFPTANIDHGMYVLPKKGIYHVEVLLGQNKYQGIANIGNNPTINTTTKARLEVHILDFNESVYDQVLVVSFIKFLRDEIKFSSKEALITQMKMDENQVRLTKN